MPYDTNITGMMKESELKVIETWAQAVPKNGIIVEVGSFLGRSAACWALSADPSVKIYSCDVFPDDRPPNSFHHATMHSGLPNWPMPNTAYPVWEMFNENIKPFKNIIPLRGEFPRNPIYPGDPIDIFFLDAAHTNPNDWDNITYFSQFLKPTSVICGHDYIPNFYPDVIENVCRLESQYNTKATLYAGGTLWSINITPR